MVLAIPCLNQNEKAMRTLLIAAAMATTMSVAAFSGGDGPFTTQHWTDGQYAQRELGQVGVYPNPASGQVNIIYPGLTGEATVTILAEDGRVMRSFEVGETTAKRSLVNLSGLRNGLYFIRVVQPSGMDVTRSLSVVN